MESLQLVGQGYSHPYPRNEAASAVVHYIMALLLSKYWTDSAPTRWLVKTRFASQPVWRVTRRSDYLLRAKRREMPQLCMDNHPGRLLLVWTVLNFVKACP